MTEEGYLQTKIRDMQERIELIEKKCNDLTSELIAEQQKFQVRFELDHRKELQKELEEMQTKFDEMLSPLLNNVLQNYDTQLSKASMSLVTTFNEIMDRIVPLLIDSRRNTDLVTSYLLSAKILTVSNLNTVQKEYLAKNPYEKDVQELKHKLRIFAGYE